MRRRDEDLFRYLIDKFASFSGISGVQPKILVRDEQASVLLKQGKPRLSQSYRGATHIVKLWESERVSATRGERVLLPHSGTEVRT